MIVLNKVMLIGNVGNKPKTKILSAGCTIARFSLATAVANKKNHVQKYINNTWYNIIAWNSLAVIIQHYVHKRVLLHIQSKLQYCNYKEVAIAPIYVATTY